MFLRFTSKVLIVLVGALPCEGVVAAAASVVSLGLVEENEFGTGRRRMTVS